MHEELCIGEAVLREGNTDHAGRHQGRNRHICVEMEKVMGAPCVSLVCKVLTPIGHPVEEILVNADEEGCEVIVMATNGKGILKHTFLGSISLSVLSRTRKPVILVPLPAQQAGTD